MCWKSYNTVYPLQGRSPTRIFNIACKLHLTQRLQNERISNLFLASNQTELRLKRNAIWLPKNWKYFTLLSALQSLPCLITDLDVSLQSRYLLPPRHLSFLSRLGFFSVVPVDFLHSHSLIVLRSAHCIVLFNCLSKKIFFKLPSPFNFNLNFTNWVY